MNTTLILPDWIAKEILRASSESRESGAVLLARYARSSTQIRLLATEIHWVHESAYRGRTPYSLSISSTGYVPALGIAENRGAMAFWVHTHPGIDGIPTTSKWDEIVDKQLGDLFRLRTGSEHYGALIFSSRRSGYAFTGFIEDDSGDRNPVEKIWVVGNRVSVTHAFGTALENMSSVFDRNILAFGPEIQFLLGKLRLGIVGCGGTGSAVAEQMSRLGVRKFTLADPDVVSPTNVTRVYGSKESDIGQYKVDVIAKHLREISYDSEVVTLKSMITVEATAQAFAACDIIFGCTDDNAGRLVLSRLATYYLIPVFDCGVLLSSVGGKISGIHGRITTLVPGQACLVCRGRIDIKRAATELLTPLERKRRVDEGYAPELGGIEPAVVTFTTMVAAAAVAELLERLIGYGPSPRPSEVLLRAHDREISTNVATPRQGHYCNVEAGKMGIGDCIPFLEQSWPN